MNETAVAIAAVALLAVVGSSTATASDAALRPPSPCIVPLDPNGAAPLGGCLVLTVEVIVGVPVSATSADDECRPRPVEVPDPRAC